MQTTHTHESRIRELTQHYAAACKENPDSAEAHALATQLDELEAAQLAWETERDQYLDDCYCDPDC